MICVVCVNTTQMYNQYYNININIYLNWVIIIRIWREVSPLDPNRSKWSVLSREWRTNRNCDQRYNARLGCISCRTLFWCKRRCLSRYCICLTLAEQCSPHRLASPPTCPRSSPPLSCLPSTYWSIDWLIRWSDTKLSGQLT